MNSKDAIYADEAERKLRNRLFWGILAFVGLLGLWSHHHESLLKYDLLADRSHKVMKHFRIGFNLGTAPEKGSTPRVVLLGNSTYHTQPTPKIMREIADREGVDVELINMAQSGTRMYDYLVQLPKVLELKPDLVVVPFFSYTFSRDYPNFATNANQMAFDPDVISRLSPDFYQRSFTVQDALDSAISSAFPIKRNEPILRWDKYRKWAYGREKILPPWFVNHFDYPTLLTPRTMKAVAVRHESKDVDPPVDDAEQLIREFLSVARAEGVRVLLIWQQSNGFVPSLDYAIKQACGDFDNVAFVNLQDEWNEEEFVDRCHAKKEFLETYAQRHFDVIAAELGTPSQAFTNVATRPASTRRN